MNEFGYASDYLLYNTYCIMKYTTDLTNHYSEVADEINEYLASEGYNVNNETYNKSFYQRYHMYNDYYYIMDGAVLIKVDGYDNGIYK